MRRKWALFGAGLAVAASTLAVAPPALAACAGTTNTVIVCVDPQGAILYEDCVVIVDPPCMPVVVRGPAVWCVETNGPLYCG